jgi:ATF/CREB family transcription factor
MLAGPANQGTPSLSLAFDSSFVRTGLTPDVGRTGFTPLIGGGFPPPSPNTNALYQLVNGMSSGAPLSSSVAITPGTLSLLNGVLNSTLNSIQHPTAISLDTQNQALIDGSVQQQQHSQQQYQQSDPYSNNENANHALSNAASALFLLSQQQNLQRQQQNQAQNQGQVNPSAVSAPPPMPSAAPDSPTTTNAASRRAIKRKSVDTPVPAPRGKKAKSTTSSTTMSTRTSNRRKSSKMDEDDEDDMDDFDLEDEDEYLDGFMPPPGTTANNRPTSGTNRNGAKKPETEEEKRRNFLERNRQGAAVFISKGTLIKLISDIHSCPQMPSTKEGLAVGIAAKSRVPDFRERTISCRACDLERGDCTAESSCRRPGWRSFGIA